MASSTTPLNSPAKKPARTKSIQISPKFSFRAAFTKDPTTASSSNTTGVPTSPSRSKLPSLRTKPTAIDHASSLGKRRNDAESPAPSATARAEFGVITRSKASTLRSKLPGPPPARWGSIATPRAGSVSPCGKVARSDSLRDVHAKGRASPAPAAPTGLPRPGPGGTLPKSRSRAGLSLIARSATPAAATQLEVRKRTQSATEAQSSASPSRMTKPHFPTSRVLRPPATISSAASGLPKRQPALKRSSSIDLSLASGAKPSSRTPSMEKPQGKENARTGPPPSFPFVGATPCIKPLKQKRSSLPVAATLIPPKSAEPTWSIAEQVTPAHARTNSVASSVPAKRPDLGIASSIIKAHPVTHPMLVALQQKQPHKPINTPDAMLKAKRRLSGLLIKPLQLPITTPNESRITPSISQATLTFPSKDVQPSPLPEKRDSEIDAELLASLRIVAKKANWNMQEVEDMVQADKKAREAKERGDPPAQQPEMSTAESWSTIAADTSLRQSRGPGPSGTSAAEDPDPADSSAAAGEESLDASPSENDSPLLKLAILRTQNGVDRAQEMRIRRALRQSVGLDVLLAQQQGEELLGLEFEGIEEVDDMSRSASSVIVLEEDRSVAQLADKVESLKVQVEPADETANVSKTVTDIKMERNAEAADAMSSNEKELHAQLAELERSRAALQAELAALLMTSVNVKSDREVLHELQVEMAKSQAKAVKRLGLVELEELQNQADALLFCRFQLDQWERMITRAGARLRV